MQTNADRSKEYVAVEKEYVAVEKEIQTPAPSMPKLPELPEFVGAIPDLAPSQCISPLQRCASRTTSSIRSWLCFTTPEANASNSKKTFPEGDPANARRRTTTPVPSASITHNSLTSDGFDRVRALSKVSAHITDLAPARRGSSAAP